MNMTRGGGALMTLSLNKTVGVEQVIVNGETAWIGGKCVGAG